MPMHLVGLVVALIISPLPVTRLPRSRIPHLSASDDDFPSDDYSGDAGPELAFAATATVTATTAATTVEPDVDAGPDNNAERSTLKQQLLALAAACNRGEAASAQGIMCGSNPRPVDRLI